MIEIFSDDDNNDRAIPCDVPIPSGSTFTVGGGGVLSKSQFKARVPSTPSTTSVRIGSGKMMQTQIGFSRKKEALGLTRVGAVEQTIGSKPSTQHASVLREDSMHVTRALEFWSCLVCTLYVSLSFIFEGNIKPEDNFFTPEKINQVNCLVQFVEHFEDSGHGQRSCHETFFSGFSRRMYKHKHCPSAFKVIPTSSKTSVIQNHFYVRVLKFIQQV